MTAASLDDDLALIRRAAAQAAELALGWFRRGPDVMIKGDSSPVTEADLAVDAFLHETLRAARPGYGWLSEERADDGSRRHAARSFIVDPIDGTRAFVAETADWCVSIGLVENGRAVAGVLHAPASGIVHAAGAGCGATRDGALLAPPGRERGPLAVAGAASLVRALEAPLGRPVRRIPPAASLALRLAAVADGGLDATIVKPAAAFWDIAAADVILAESGRTLIGLDGGRPDYAAESVKLGAMCAAPADLAPRIAGILAEAIAAA